MLKYDRYFIDSVNVLLDRILLSNIEFTTSITNILIKLRDVLIITPAYGGEIKQTQRKICMRLLTNALLSFKRV